VSFICGGRIYMRTIQKKHKQAGMWKKVLKKGLSKLDPSG